MWLSSPSPPNHFRILRLLRIVALQESTKYVPAPRGWRHEYHDYLAISLSNSDAREERSESLNISTWKGEDFTTTRQVHVLWSLEVRASRRRSGQQH
jgi:hypothetical protein